MQPHRGLIAIFAQWWPPPPPSAQLHPLPEFRHPCLLRRLQVFVFIQKDAPPLWYVSL